MIKPALTGQLTNRFDEVFHRVQQMHPLVSSTSFSSVRSKWPCPAMRAASMFTSLMSFTITATRRPLRLARM